MIDTDFEHKLQLLVTGRSDFHVWQLVRVRSDGCIGSVKLDTISHAAEKSRMNKMSKLFPR